MFCPKCAYPNIPAGARFCPECGAPVELVTRAAGALLGEVQISQEVRENLGRMIGVQTGAIHGDVYGGDIYEVQLYALSGEGRAAGWRRFLKEDTPPYKFLAPYSARDQALFKGRDAEIELVVRRIGEQRVLVLHGPPGAGKTSLLAAGVIPALTEAGALVVHIQDYARPAETIRAALAANADQVPIPLPDPPTLPGLARAVYQATQGSLVFIFDQFERLFEPPIGQEQRAAFLAELAAALEAVGPEYLRVIIAVREEALSHLAGADDRPPLLSNFLLGAVPLAPLTGRQAQAAIEGPLAELHYPVSFVGDLVPRQLVPDLDELTPDTPDRIEPPQLQIVCHWLYQAARGRHPPHIDPHLYAVEAKGADGILARYLEETLRTQLAGREALARQLLVAMAAPEAGRWITPARLALRQGGLASDAAAPEQVRDLLDRLEGAGLLVSRRADGGREYAFTSFCVAQEARRLAGPEVERRYQAGDELERIWAAWLARDALATRGQLRYLAAAATHLTPPPVKALLLLRSAVARDEPAGPWLAWLRNDAGRALIGQLEGDPDLAGRDGADKTPAPSALAKAGLLLGLALRKGGLADVTPRPPAPLNPPNFGGEGGAEKPFGPVAWAAVTHPDPAVRQTAGLVLTVTDRHRALDRLDWALKAGAKGWRRRVRQAELRGALADADPEVEKLNTDLPLLERGGIWLWRVRKRLIRERHCIAGLTLGGAIAAGLGLALLRGLTAALTRYTVGLHFAMNFYWGALLAAALTLGFLLAGPLLLRPGCEKSPAPRPFPWRGSTTILGVFGSPRPPRSPQYWGDGGALGAGLAALLFGLMHWLIAALIGLDLSRAPLVPVLGFVAGLGLSLAPAWPPVWGARAAAPSAPTDAPTRDRLQQERHLVTVSLVAGLAFIFIQALFILAGGAGGESLAIVWPGRLYRADLARHAAAWWQWVMNNVPGWYHYVALLDAGLAGGMLAAGTAIGVRLAGRWLARWQELVERAGE